MKRALIPLLLALLIAVGIGGYFLGRTSERPPNSADSAQPVHVTSIERSPVSTAAELPRSTSLAPAGTTDQTTAALPPVSARNSEDSHNSAATSAKKPAASKTTNGITSDELRKSIDAAFATMNTEDVNKALQSPMVAAHQLVQTQPVDQAWAPGVDQAISNRLSDDLGSQFNVDAIDCRTDICELRVWGYLPAGHRGVDNFQKEIFDLQRQGWFDQLGVRYESFALSGVGGGGPAVFLVYLTRK